MLNDHEACYRVIETGDSRFDGRIYTGVKTTGIYCRPVCPARTPSRRNVEFFPSAAAAQNAGYRPCLRCRPELSPAPGNTGEFPDVVTRALNLITDGAFDEDGIPALAVRIGISERQLRRLFIEHLGASPLKIIQTRRVLFAKQLLHDTKLSMAEVAMAAGFGSIRRFNATFTTLFGRPPRSLRRETTRRGAHARSHHDGNWIELRLGFRPPLDWDFFLSFYRARAIPGLETIVDECYRRVIALNGGVGQIEVRPGGADYLIGAIRFDDVTALPAIVCRMRNAFDLDADPLLINQHLASDRVLRDAVAARPGLRVVGNWDPFEQAVRAVLGQQISVTAARNLAGRLVARWGEPVTIDGEEELRFAFPTPARLADADIASLGMPRRRGAAVSALAKAVLANADFLNRGASLNENLRRLEGLPGFGKWTANYIAMRAMREPDAFPASDIGLLRALAQKDGRRPTPDEALARAERWRPWRAYAAQHLWAKDPISGGEVKA
ncbi:MAG: helix-turn-helix domain-containing protein [Proteobacteria bacterium]|nr:helix-turn-helix domain-containing protein [Pseudomonadota bacterium]